MVCKVPWLRLLHIAYDKPLIGYCYTGRGDNSGAVFTVIDHITQILHYSMHDRGFGLIGPRQVHAGYKMYTYKTIYMLVRHDV